MITPKQLLRLTAKWLVISVLVLFGTLWLVDELSFQYKTHTSSAAGAYGAVDMQRMLAIEKKGGKIEYTMDRTQPPQVEQCVYSLFPHAGLKPCWYLQRRVHQPVLLVILSSRALYFDLRNFPRGLFDTLEKAALLCFHQPKERPEAP